MVVFVEVSCYKCLYICILDVFMVFHQFACRTVIYVIPHTLFCFHFITVSYSYIIHLIAETDDQHILRVCPTCTNAHPNGNLVLGVFVFPVTYHYFAADAHTGTDMSEFAVTMGGLIQIHEVHIHGIPRNFLIELSV